MKRIINLKFFIFLFFLPTFYLLSTTYSLYAQDTIVAIVNNEVITQKDLDDFLNFMKMQLSREYKGKELEEKVTAAKSDMLNRLIEDRLILQEAKKDKISVEESRIRSKINEIKKRYKTEGEFQAELLRQGLSLADIERKIREQFLMFGILEKDVRAKIKVRPDEVTDFYEKNNKEFVSGEEREVVAYALDNEDLAGTFSYSLKNGNKPEDLATRYPFTVNKLSLRQTEGMDKNMEEAVFKLGLNEVTDALKIQDKYYVFKLINIIPSSQFTLSQSQDKIQTYLFERKMQQELVKWLDELRKQSYIKIQQN